MSDKALKVWRSWTWSGKVNANMKWRSRGLMNLMFYFTKLKGVFHVGDGGARLPRHVRNSKAVIGLMKTGAPYYDNLCAFRCLALLENCQCEKMTAHANAHRNVSS